jgi:hypothetical protein
LAVDLVSVVAAVGEAAELELSFSSDFFSLFSDFSSGFD